ARPRRPSRSATSSSVPTAARSSSRDLTDYVAERGGTAVVLQVERDGAAMDIEVTPRVVSDEERAQGIGPIGFSYDPAQIVEEPSTVTGPFDALGRGLD